MKSFQKWNPMFCMTTHRGLSLKLVDEINSNKNKKKKWKYWEASCLSVGIRLWRIAERLTNKQNYNIKAKFIVVISFKTLLGMQKLYVSDVYIYSLLKQDKKIKHHQRHIHHDSSDNSRRNIEKSSVHLERWYFH